MMNYVEEIKKLENKVIGLTESIDILRDRENQLCEDFQRKQVYSGADRYVSRIAEISMLADELDARRCKIQKQIDRLKKEYRRLHTREFYRPMDEIDISDIIKKNGCIVAVKF